MAAGQARFHYFPQPRPRLAMSLRHGLAI